MAREIAPAVVAAFQQGSVNEAALVDIFPGTGSEGVQPGSAVRCFQGGGGQLAEFRMGIAAAGVWDLFMVDGAGVPGSVLTSTGSGNLFIPNLGTPPGGSVDLAVDSNGQVFKQSSSLRYKDNVKPLDEDFSKIMALQPISFTSNGGTAEQIGYAAEDVAAAGLEHLVTRDDLGRPEAVSYKHLGIYAIELLRKQMAVVQEQAAELLRLRENLGSLEARLAAG